MKKLKLVAIAGVMLVVGVLALDYNKNPIEQINDQLANNPSAAGSQQRFGAVDSARNNSNGGTAGFRTGTSTTSVYKVKNGNVTSYSDVPSRTVIAANDNAEIIEIKTPKPPTTEKTSDDQQIKHSKWESQFAMFPQDKNGWSIITPSVDSRMIYVSSSDGDDSKAKAYFSKDIPDPRYPPASVVAFKTISEALKLQRDGYPDWVLLKKGDEWQLDKTIYLRSGRSTKAPLVITSYGNSIQRPLINSGLETSIYLLKSRSFIAITGVEFYANYRDPDSTSFAGWSSIGAANAFVSVTGDTKEVESILLEDNVFKFYSIGVVLTGKSRHKHITVRRNQFLNSYSTTGHSQGMFADNGSILIEENLLDHNGWYQQNYGTLNTTAQGQATYFNHNAYLADMLDTVIINNIFSHSSSIGIKLATYGNNSESKNEVISKNIIVDNNLFIEGEVGISAGGNTDYNNGYRWKNMTITNNVLLNIGKSQPTRRTLAWYIEADDWDGGVISGNYLLCNNNSDVKNVLGVYVKGLGRNISVQDNILYGLKGSNERMIFTSTNENQTDILFENNSVSNDASCKTLPFSDESYINDFITGVKKQSRVNWNSTYTASKFNENVKSSFIK
ncbi:hypothetical protein LCGC14_0480240 [marine sediment metagenome]|uniref:Right handed beta helix domain-containing protein n=1 Tax=marine sediment metagenome TaxID=412755 RepID=A0A0F9UWI3_9ZZZZ|nr:hypothetical protein [Methylophaga sp.]